MDYYYKRITWRKRNFNIRLYDWCSLRIHDLHVPIWKVKKLKKNRYKTNRVFLHKRLKRLLSSLNLKRLIERKKEAKRDRNIRDLTNPYIIPNLQLIHDVIITAKTGSEAMVMDEMVQDTIKTNIVTMEEIATQDTTENTPLVQSSIVGKLNEDAPREIVEKELDIQVKNQQEEGMEYLNRSQKKKRKRKTRIMNAGKRVEMEQLSDCDFPSTKEKVKIEEVELRGDRSYRYRGIPVIMLEDIYIDTDEEDIDFKEQLKCPYCSKIYPDQTNLKPHIEKKHKKVLERMKKTRQ